MRREEGLVGGELPMGLQGGRRLSAFHCVASRSRISPKILIGVAGRVDARDHG